MSSREELRRKDGARVMDTEEQMCLPAQQLKNSHHFSLTG